jgi:predicted regulator of Ras-like GTPase activity (Roadblock/LC7/MglB family)
MTKHHHRLVSVISLLILGALFYFSDYRLDNIRAGTGDNISGYAWSSNIGWISFNCTNSSSCGNADYGLRVDNATGLFSGYAWSPNIGWVSFSQPDLSGCPSVPCEARVSGGLTGAYPKQVTGWAKVLSTNNWMSLRGNISPISIIESGSGAGLHNGVALAIGSDGLPIVPYLQIFASKLKFAECGNHQCSAGNFITDVASTPSGAGNINVAIGSDSFPVITYVDSQSGEVRAIKCGNSSCSSGNSINLIEDLNSSTAANSIFIGSDGLPIVAYVSPQERKLKIAKCGNSACSSGNTITTIDPGGMEGSYIKSYDSPSISMSSDGRAIVSYLETGQNYKLKVIKCGNSLCNSGNVTTVVDGSGVSEFNSLILGSDGLPIIAYQDWDPNRVLKVVKCGNSSCSSGNSITTVDSAGAVGLYPAIAIGADGMPIIAYQDSTSYPYDLKFAKCGNAACTSGNIITKLNSPRHDGYYNKIAVGADGLPIVAYRDVGNDSVSVFKCREAGCTSVSEIAYGVQLESSGDFIGWSWESTDIGWLSWSGASYGVHASAIVLSVTKPGDGSGTVTGPGINCGSDCSETISAGTQVTLTAVPEPGSVFTGWTGCDSVTFDNKCVVTVSASRTVVANFKKSAVPSQIKEVRPQ